MVFVAAMAIGAFYWFLYRPAQIRRACDAEAVAALRASLSDSPSPAWTEGMPIEQGLFARAEKKAAYERCMRNRGMGAIGFAP